ncbi:hypothetical protein ACQKMY_03335 [Peribacillus frigoritolerans]|uniref:hypothetical protein n=1 Tax=Peribacillus frigoritolerans TaxID=450367 RepID=UPI003CFCC766
MSYDAEEIFSQFDPLKIDTVSPAKNVRTPHTKDEDRLICVGLSQEMLREVLIVI